MQTALRKCAWQTANSAKASSTYRPVRVCKRVALARSSNASRRAAVECRAFFNFFTPKPAAPVSAMDPRAKPLVEQLIDLTSGTDTGAKASAAQKEEIAAVVIELSRYCMKNPLKSDLLFGEWKVLFSSKPTAVGGPLRSGVGPTVFSGQDAKQIIEAPNKVINSVEYKTLGFLPGYSRQYGEIEPISSDTFILNITNGELMAGLGGPVKKEFNIQRKIKILYLDDEIRVAQFLPSDLPDTEADQNGGRSQEDVVFVFQRIKEAAEAEEEVAGDEDDGEVAPAKPAFFGGGRKLESAATVAERQVRQQLKEQRGGTGRLAAAQAAKAAAAAGSSKALVVVPRPGTSVRGRRQQQVEEEEDPRERRRRELEEERARKAAEAEAKTADVKAAREKAEAERQAERERQVAIKELLAELAAEVKQRQAEAREALKELKEVEKTVGASLKEVASARSRFEEAEGDVKAVAADLDAAIASKRELEKEAKAAKEVVLAAEKTLRALKAASAPVLTRK